MSIPLRDFGSSGDKISALGLGGHHLGDAKDEDTAIQIVHEAVEGGITFFDNCWEYNRGKSENWMGKGLRGLRDRVFLMTKVCTHGRDASLAMQMLEQSLRRLQTDHLDLWQIHGVSFDKRSAPFHPSRRRRRGAHEGKKGRQGALRRIHRPQGA
jgi:aryl-alcohol dehydrogenase-like predicted oxidoreductase